MNDELTLKLVESLAKLDATMQSIQKEMLSFDKRITKLEDSKPTLKNDVINWLVKGLVASIFVIGSLCGASGILKSIFNI